MTAPAQIMPSADARKVPSSNIAALAALALLAVGYSPTLMAFPGAWLDFRTHGFVIAALCAWLIWSSRTRIVPDTVDPIPARLAAVLCSLLWLLAVVLGTRVIHMTVLPLALLAWTAAAFGLPTMRRMLPCGRVRWGMGIVNNGGVAVLITTIRHIRGRRCRFFQHEHADSSCHPKNCCRIQY